METASSRLNIVTSNWITIEPKFNGYLQKNIYDGQINTHIVGYKPEFGFLSANLNRYVRTLNIQ